MTTHVQTTPWKTLTGGAGSARTGVREYIGAFPIYDAGTCQRPSCRFPATSAMTFVWVGEFVIFHLCSGCLLEAIPRLNLATTRKRRRNSFTPSAKSPPAPAATYSATADNKDAVASGASCG